MRLYLDTHVLVWLYQDGPSRLTAVGQASIDSAATLVISPIVELELTYLHEIKRITCPAITILDTLNRDLELERCRRSFASIVGEAVGQGWTRDPFDRLIVAQAAYGQDPLLTADKNIRENYELAFW